MPDEVMETGLCCDESTVTVWERECVGIGIGVLEGGGGGEAPTEDRAEPWTMPESDNDDDVDETRYCGRARLVWTQEAAPDDAAERAEAASAVITGEEFGARCPGLDAWRPPTVSGDREAIAAEAAIAAADGGNDRPREAGVPPPGVPTAGEFKGDWPGMPSES